MSRFIKIKTSAQIKKMRMAGKYLAQWMNSITSDIVKSSTTLASSHDINIDFCNFVCVLNDSYQNRFDTPFKYVPGNNGIPYGFPTCVSVNDEIVHSKPTRRQFQTGDIISIDAGLSFDGWCADMCRTVSYHCPKSRISSKVKHILDEATKLCVPGTMISEIARYISQAAKEDGWGCIIEYTGHGIGKQLHELPIIPNAPEAIRKDVMLREGMTICLEPLLCMGSPETVLDSDGWRVFTADGANAAHAENTILVTKEPIVLTR
jgi:methionyl aminopeptidase